MRSYRDLVLVLRAGLLGRPAEVPRRGGVLGFGPSFWLGT